MLLPKYMLVYRECSNCKLEKEQELNRRSNVIVRKLYQDYYVTCDICGVTNDIWYDDIPVRHKIFVWLYSRRKYLIDVMIIGLMVN